jgi:hypothetical protein
MRRSKPSPLHLTFKLDFGLPKLNSPYRLRAGDVVLFENRPCPVLRVSDCAAVIAVNKPSRQFTTLFGVSVRIRPKPALVRISCNSLCPILKRRGKP